MTVEPLEKAIRVRAVRADEVVDHWAAARLAIRDPPLVRSRSRNCRGGEGFTAAPAVLGRKRHPWMVTAMAGAISRAAAASGLRKRMPAARRPAGLRCRSRDATSSIGGAAAARGRALEYLALRRTGGRSRNERPPGPAAQVPLRSWSSRLPLPEGPRRRARGRWACRRALPARPSRRAPFRRVPRCRPPPSPRAALRSAAPCPRH
jgi:hypothetical protein